MKTAIAIVAHPDDIEFMMSGTLLLLKNADYEIHYMNLASGNCGSIDHNREETGKIRMREGKKAAENQDSSIEGAQKPAELVECKPESEFLFEINGRQFISDRTYVKKIQNTPKDGAGIYITAFVHPMRTRCRTWAKII
jgi:hypothetical protein